MSGPYHRNVELGEDLELSEVYSGDPAVTFDVDRWGNEWDETGGTLGLDYIIIGD